MTALDVVNVANGWATLVCGYDSQEWWRTEDGCYQETWRRWVEQTVERGIEHQQPGVTVRLHEGIRYVTVTARLIEDAGIDLGAA